MNVTITRIDHLVLTVSDVEATCAFYARALGMRPITTDDGRRALQFGRHKFNLHQAGREFEPKALHPTPGSADICLITEDKLDDFAAHIRECDVPIELGPVERLGAEGLMDSIYFRDLDGNLIEVSQYWDAARQREQAVRDLEAGQAGLEAWFARLSDAQMEQPATIGAGEWSAKDLLGHVAAWEELALQALGTRDSWHTALPGEAGWPGVDPFNARVYERSSRQPLDEIRREAARTHALLLNRLPELTDNEWHTLRGDRTLGYLLGSLTGGQRGPFRHALDHLDDLRAYVERAPAAQYRREVLPDV